MGGGELSDIPKPNANSARERSRAVWGNAPSLCVWSFWKAVSCILERVLNKVTTAKNHL